jgi:hypothetical protein
MVFEYRIIVLIIYIIAIKQDFRNEKFVFCVIGNEISFWIFPENLFYDYTIGILKHICYNLCIVIKQNLWKIQKFCFILFHFI